MPGTDTREEKQGGRLSSLLFWAGVGMAPLAAVLLLMVSGDTKLRAAIGVLTLSVILIGLSVTMRRDGDVARAALEDMVFDEIDAVRADVRDDISTAAHATHRAFSEKMQYLVEQLQVTRAELDATRAQLEALRADPMRQPMAPASAGVRQHAAAAAPAAHHAAAPHPSAGPGRPGVVRHTETVQVTTRHTVVDPHNDEPARGGVYGGEYVTTRAEPRAAARPEREESWTEQRLREQLSRRTEDEPSWSRHAPERDEQSWPSVSAGDRWAAVRDDEHGRELRMGERRVAAHRDDAGAEVRIEDRWAAVRREAARSGFKWREEQADDGNNGFTWRESAHDDRPAIAGSDREERWSHYADDYAADYRDERERRYR